MSEKVAYAESVFKKNADKSLLSFTMTNKKDYRIGNHHTLIAKKLQGVYEGKIKRLMIFLPPRHGKTEIASIQFPAWAMGKNPNLRMIGCSYGAELANKNNRLIQRIIDTPEYKSIFPNTYLNDSSWAHRGYVRNATNFEIVKAAGSYRSAGVNGVITGTGADILLIDDPIKNKKEANSVVYREALWDWYTSTAYTRLEKDGAIVLIQTRWHEDDLAGRLLEQMKNGGDYADQWDVLSLEAIKEGENRFGDYDWREQGEALWPWKYDLDKLLRIKKNVGTSTWTGLYQQRPTPISGSLIKTEWWKYYKQLPMEEGQIVQFWDTAQKPGITNDYSVCATWLKLSAGYYLLDLWRNKVEGPELEKMAIANYHKWMPNRVVIEDKSSGSSLIQYLQRKTTIPVLAVNPTKDKQLRAIEAAPTIQAGNCYLPIEARWLADYILEHEQFPNGSFDDQVDTTSNMVAFFTQFENANPRVRSL